MPLTSKSKRVAIGAGSSDRKGTYFGRLISLGAALTSGPVIAGVESGGTGVAAATGAAGEPAAAGAAPAGAGAAGAAVAGAAVAGAVLGAAGAAPPELSAHALWAQ